MSKSTPATIELVAPTGSRFAIVCARWNAGITDKLLEGAMATLRAADVADDHIFVTRVPGAYELPVAASHLAKMGRFDAIICLGAVIKGDTDHDQYINSSVAGALQSIGVDTGIPCIFGLLTCNTGEQAADRAGGKSGNKGTEAAEAAVEMAALLRKLATEAL